MGYIVYELSLLTEYKLILGRGSQLSTEAFTTILPLLSCK